MKFREMVERYATGELRTDQLPVIAMQAIEEDYDSPSLCQLAVLENADPQRINTLFSRVLDELQICLPSAEPFLVVRRHPYEEPHNVQLEFIATNGRFTGGTDIYCTADDIKEVHPTRAYLDSWIA
jgi:hypothetical protein